MSTPFTVHRLHTTMMRLHLALLLTHVLNGPGAEAAESALVRQGPAFLAADVAGRVSLKCFSEAHGQTWIFWYKQTPRRKPVIVSGVYMHDKAVYFYDEFRNDSRFTLGTQNDNYCLNISDLRTSDSGTYYCAASKFYDFEFAEGTVVSVGGLGASVRASFPADAGSRSLECRVEAGGVGGEHRFRDREGSHPGVVRATEQTHTCGYNLLMDSRNTSRTGIYCAAASCGHILFGNQNSTDFGAKERDLGLLYVLSGTLAFTVTLTFSLAVSLCRRSSCNSKGSMGRSPSAANGGFGGDDPNLQYEPLTFEVPNRCRVKKPQTECVYSLASTSHIDTL